MRRKISRLAVVAAALVAISLPASAAFAYGPGTTGTLALSTSTCSNAAGCSPTASGTGFQPGEPIDLSLHSTPVDLGTTTADSSGDFSTVVNIPAGTSAGTHSIVATGETSGTVATTTFTVTAATTSTPSSTGLPITGADIAALVGVGAVAVALGGLLVLTSRRRRSRVPTS